MILFVRLCVFVSVCMCGMFWEVVVMWWFELLWSLMGIFFIFWCVLELCGMCVWCVCCVVCGCVGGDFLFVCVCWKCVIVGCVRMFCGWWWMVDWMLYWWCVCVWWMMDEWCVRWRKCFWVCLWWFLFYMFCLWWWMVWCGCWCLCTRTREGSRRWRWRRCLRCMNCVVWWWICVLVLWVCDLGCDRCCVWGWDCKWWGWGCCSRGTTGGRSARRSRSLSSRRWFVVLWRIWWSWEGRWWWNLWCLRISKSCYLSLWVWLLDWRIVLRGWGILSARRCSGWVTRRRFGCKLCLLLWCYCLWCLDWIIFLVEWWRWILLWVWCLNKVIIWIFFRWVGCFCSGVEICGLRCCCCFFCEVLREWVGCVLLLVCFLWVILLFMGSCKCGCCNCFLNRLIKIRRISTWRWFGTWRWWAYCFFLVVLYNWVCFKIIWVWWWWKWLLFLLVFLFLCIYLLWI